MRSNSVFPPVIYLLTVTIKHILTIVQFLSHKLQLLRQQINFLNWKKTPKTKTNKKPNTKLAVKIQFGLSIIKHNTGGEAISSSFFS